MCLDFKDPVPENVPNVCYKVFGLSKEGLYRDMKGQPSIRPVGVWLEANDFTQFRMNGKVSKNALPIVNVFDKKEVYEAGWHCFVDLEGACLWRDDRVHYGVRKVKVEDLICTGIQYCEGVPLKIAVFRKIFILEEE